MPENQNPKPYLSCAGLLPRKFIAATFLRKFDTVNTSKKALAIADAIATAHECGKVSNVEQFLDLIKQSPDQSQTIRMLKQGGRHPLDVAIGGNRYATGGRPRFPLRLETTYEFRVVLYQFSDINETHIMAFIKAVNESTANEIARTAFSLRRKYKLNIESSADAFLLRQLAVSGYPVEILVTGSLLIAENVINELTLVKVINKDALRPVVEGIHAQLELGLASA